MYKNKKEQYVASILDLLSRKVKPSLHYYPTYNNDVLKFYFMGNLMNGKALIYRDLGLEVVSGIDVDRSLIVEEGLSYSYFSNKKYNINGVIVTERSLISEARNIINFHKKQGYYPSILKCKNDEYRGINF